MTITKLDHLNLSVANFRESVDWYGKVFGFELVEEGMQSGLPWGIIQSGDALLCIYENPKLAYRDRFDRARLGLHGVNHFALRIDDPDAWREVAERHGVEVKYGGQIEWDHSDAWYVNDPTGYEIEVAFWREGKPAFHPLEQQASV